MGLKDDLAAAKANRPEPTLQQIAVGESLYQVEIMRLPGLEWAAITAECPPSDERGARLGYDTNKAALLACRRFSRLLDIDGEPVSMAPDRDENGKAISDPWGDVFAAISGVEIGAIAATWWALNMHDPNERVKALKKALAAGD